MCGGGGGGGGPDSQDPPPHGSAPCGATKKTNFNANQSDTHWHLISDSNINHLPANRRDVGSSQSDIFQLLVTK